MNSDLLQGFYLDDLLVEPLKGQVTGRDGSRHLPPMAVEVLLCLARSPGELVTRKTLLDAVWGSGRGTQESLSHAVSELRHALGDRLDDPHFIQTLPTRGYRLVHAPVFVDQDTSSIVIGAGNSPDFSNIGLFENLKRRGVFETALAYLIVGWLLIQIADIIFAQLHLPPWAATFITVLVIAGFPIAIVLSWFLDYRDGQTTLDVSAPLASRRQRFSRTYLSIIGALAAASALVFIYDVNVGLPTAENAISVPVALEIKENAIAVLPFLNNDGSEETQAFANGLVEDVITRLSRVPGLLVSSRGDSFTLVPNSASDLVRRRLRVAMYIEGSVEISGDTIRVIVQLIDSANGFHILSRTFDHPKKDFFAIRDEITSVTVSSLRVTLPENTQERSSASSHTPDIDAYVLYRRGVDASRKPDTVSTVSDALAWFDAALEIDPEYAAAFAGKCSTLATNYPLTFDPATVQRAEIECGRALELNPNLDMVHNALGDLYSLTGRYAESEVAYLEALRINPKNVSSLTGLANALHLQHRPVEAEETLRSAIGLQPGNWAPYNALGYFYFRQGRFAEAAEQFISISAFDSNNTRGIGNAATSYMMAGRFEEAAPLYQQAIDIEPQADMYSNLGLMYYYLGRYEQAASALRSALALEPNDHLAWSNLGDVLFVDGKTADASESFLQASRLVEQAATVMPNDPGLLMDTAWIAAMLGNQEEALTVIDRALKAAPEDPYGEFILALITNHDNDAAGALTALERAVEKGYSKTIIAAEPHLSTLRSHARFKSIVASDAP